MLIFLERTPEYEPLRLKFELKLSNYFNSTVKISKPQNTKSASSFAELSSPYTPRSNSLVKLKNTFWLRLATKYAYKGFTHFIETITNKIDLKNSCEYESLSVKLLKLQFRTGIQLDMKLLMELIQNKIPERTQLMFMLFYLRSGVESKFADQAEFILKKKLSDLGHKNKENKREFLMKQRTDKVGLG
jgi:hypothetical protein